MTATGTWDPHKARGDPRRCTVTNELRVVNLVVKDGSLDSVAKWSGSSVVGFNDLPGTPLEPDTPTAPMVHSHTDVGGYTPVKQCRYNGYGTSVSVSIRSANDPYVEAARLTDYNGKVATGFDFGPSVGENVATGTTYLLLGLLLTCAPIIGGCALFRFARGAWTKTFGGGSQVGVAEGGGIYDNVGPAVVATPAPVAMATAVPVAGGGSFEMEGMSK
eukprot:SAG22_NODE_4269_length_1322_cov_1.756337_1_plen_218_part_00